MNSKQLYNDLQEKWYADLSIYNQATQLKLSWLPQTLQMNIRTLLKTGDYELNGFYLCKKWVRPVDRFSIESIMSPSTPVQLNQMPTTELQSTAQQAIVVENDRLQLAVEELEGENKRLEDDLALQKEVNADNQIRLDQKTERIKDLEEQLKQYQAEPDFTVPNFDAPVANIVPQAKKLKSDIKKIESN